MFLKYFLPIPYWDSIQSHRWPWGHLWSILGLNISNFNLLSILFEPENHLFWSLAIELFGKKWKTRQNSNYSHETATESSFNWRENHLHVRSKKILNMQKFDTKNTYFYQKICKFYAGKSEKLGKIAIIRMKMQRNQAPIAEKTICLQEEKISEICRNLTLKIGFCIKKFGVFSLENQQYPVFHKDE